MNKTELITAASERSGMSKKDTEAVLNALLDAMTDALAQGDKVQLTGFGNFEVKQRDARVGRNPRTGETMEIAAAKVPAFKPGKLLRDRVAE